MGPNNALVTTIEGPYGTLTLTPSLAGAVQTANLTFTPNSSTYATLAGNASVSFPVTYTIRDVDGDTATATVNVTIRGVNDAPTAPASQPLVLDEDTPSTATAIGASDVDGDTLSYGLKTDAGPGKGVVSFNQAAGTFTYTPTLNANGTDSFTIVISDGNGGKTEQVVNVTINAVNDVPTAPASQPLVLDEDTPSTATAIGASDVDGDTLSYGLKTAAGPGKGAVSFNQAAGTFTYTPTLNANGTDSFTIVIDDGKGGKIEQVVNVTINAVNDVPTAPASQPLVLDEDTPSTATAIGASDVDGDTLSYGLKTDAGPGKGVVSFNPAAGTFTYTPTLNANGTDSFTIVIDDGNGGKIEQVVNVTINPVNDAPTAPASQPLVLDEDTPSTAITIGASDVDGDTLSYGLKTAAGPGKGAVSFNQAAGTFTYTPTLNANGTDSFTIVIDDGKGGKIEQVVNVTINAVNDAPTATKIVANLTETLSEFTNKVRTNLGEDLKEIDLLNPANVNDVDGGTLSIRDVMFDGGKPNYISVVGNKLVVDVNSRELDDVRDGTSKTVTATYTVSDGNGGSTINTVDIVIAGTDDLYREVGTITAQATHRLSDARFGNLSNTLNLVKESVTDKTDAFDFAFVGQGTIALQSQGLTGLQSVTVTDTGTLDWQPFINVMTAGRPAIGPINLADGAVTDSRVDYNVQFLTIDRNDAVTVKVEQQVEYYHLA